MNSTSNQAEFGSDIRLLDEHEVNAVNGGWLIAAIIGAELFAIGVGIGYVIADQQLPKEWRDWK